MDSARIKSIYISNLDFISYQSNEIIRNEGSNIYYSDFYNFYTPYIKHLKEVKWNNNKIEDKVKKFPMIQRPGLLFTLFLISFIPWLATVFSSFDVFKYLIYSIPLIAVIFSIHYFMNQRNKKRLGEIVKLCSSLRKEIEQLD
ncbi:MAG TPA: hypothetical protein VD908_05070 [Cytophagales bacterium]|nr:hypothetical protein [Cytophagales bacterium]